MARPREFDESAVVSKAMAVFWAKGYTATSVQDLVEATGLQRGSLYGAFGDKHGLYLAALDQYVAGSVAPFRSMVASAADPVDAVRELIVMLGAECTGPDAGRGCLVANTCSELAHNDDAARERVEAFSAAFKSELAGALRAGQTTGSFDASRDPEAVATFILCNVHGLALMGKTHPDPRAVDQVVAEMLRALT